jgi:hypothetical protein
MEQLGSHWTDFEKLCIWAFFFFLQKSVEKIQVLLKSEKDNRYSTWRRFHIYGNISLNSSYNENVSNKGRCKHFTNAPQCSVIRAMHIVLHYEHRKKKMYVVRMDQTSFIHSSVICHTTGPKPLPKRFLHLMRSRASSFKWEYHLLSPSISHTWYLSFWKETIQEKW